MNLPPAEARGRFAACPRAILATVRPDGTPHLVPIVFALVDEVVYSAIDHKPKRSQRLQRLENLRHEPRCALLVDRYDDDWSQLWWVRADGRAEVLEAPNVVAQGAAALIERYPAYQDQAPMGPYLRIEVVRWSGWSAG
jgi:PPOX class probable F420-dependent enzyme